MANERDRRQSDVPRSGGNTGTIVGVVVAVIILLILAFWFWPAGDDAMVDEPNVESIRQGEGTDPEGIADVPGEPGIGDDETVIENGASTGLDPVTDQTLEVPDSGDLDTTPGDAPVVEEDEPVAEEQ
jgi:hypothetical protein